MKNEMAPTAGNPSYELSVEVTHALVGACRFIDTAVESTSWSA